MVGQIHQLTHLHTSSQARVVRKDSVAKMFVTPQHSPLLSMPVLFFFGLWVGDGILAKTVEFLARKGIRNR